MTNAPRASEHIRAAAIENVYERRAWDHGLQEALARDQAPLPADYVSRVQAALAAAPPLFTNAFTLLVQEQLAEAAQAFSACMVVGEEGMTKEWAATACCCAAYCVAELGSYDEAVKMAGLAKKLGFNEVGGYYYFSAAWKAFNQLDQLPEALAVADEGIAYFSEHGSPGDVTSNLGRRANILKQIASHLSRSPEPHRARPVIVDAIKAFCDSLAIATVGWEEDGGEELKAMGTIAARVGISRRDLTFLNTMPEVQRLVAPYFR